MTPTAATALPAPVHDVAAVRTVHVELCMGTAFTIDVRDPGDWTAAIADAVAWLHRVDRVFSTYRDSSELNRINRGELRVVDADPLVGEVLTLCAQLQRETGGWFSARRHRAIDPTGLVKGWAIERASRLLREAGSDNHAVNGGGDLQLAGEQSPGRPWQVGIADPADPGALLAVVAVRDGAVATSGTAERGHHIVDPFTGRPAEGLRAASLVGSSLTRVDACATAAVAMSAAAPEWLEALDGIEALTVGVDGRVATTRGWRALASGVSPRTLR